eukprot:1161965-Pelagomonas_calceolata.AAC.11
MSEGLQARWAGLFAVHLAVRLVCACLLRGPARNAMLVLSTLLMSGDVAGQLGGPCMDTSPGCSRVAEEEEMMQRVMKKMGRPYKQSTLDRLMFLSLHDGWLQKKVACWKATRAHKKGSSDASADSDSRPHPPIVSLTNPGQAF